MDGIQADDVTARIATLLTESILREPNGPLGPDVPLVEDGLNLDSVQLLELLVGVEDAFGITIEDEELSLDLFATIGSLARFVQAKRDAAATAGRPSQAVPGEDAPRAGHESA